MGRTVSRRKHDVYAWTTPIFYKDLPVIYPLTTDPVHTNSVQNALSAVCHI